MSLLSKRLAQAASDKRVVDISCELTLSETVTGVITQLEDEFLCLIEFTDNGDYDGICVLRISRDITRVDWGGREKEGIARLIERKGKAPDLLPLKLKSIAQAIEELNKRYGYVALFLEDEEHFLIGSLVEYDHECLELLLYGTKRTMDRASVLIRLENVAKVQVDGVYEKNLLSLFRDQS